jgi:hypothetical protein
MNQLSSTAFSLAILMSIAKKEDNVKGLECNIRAWGQAVPDVYGYKPNEFCRVEVSLISGVSVQKSLGPTQYVLYELNSNSAV